MGLREGGVTTGDKQQCSSAQGENTDEEIRGQARTMGRGGGALVMRGDTQHQGVVRGT
jgi:hypothetical protein